MPREHTGKRPRALFFLPPNFKPIKRSKKEEEKAIAQDMRNVQLRMDVQYNQKRALFLATRARLDFYLLYLSHVVERIALNHLCTRVSHELHAAFLDVMNQQDEKSVSETVRKQKSEAEAALNETSALIKQADHFQRSCCELEIYHNELAEEEKSDALKSVNELYAKNKKVDEMLALLNDAYLCLSRTSRLFEETLTESAEAHRKLTQSYFEKYAEIVGRMNCSFKKVIYNRMMLQLKSQPRLLAGLVISRNKIFLSSIERLEPTRTNVLLRTLQVAGIGLPESHSWVEVPSDETLRLLQNALHQFRSCSIELFAKPAPRLPKQAVPVAAAAASSLASSAPSLR